MNSSVCLAIKPCTLEERAIEILKDLSSQEHFLSYSDAVDGLAKFRITRKMAMKLLAELNRRGLLEASCGHGVKLIEVVRADG